MDIRTDVSLAAGPVTQTARTAGRTLRGGVPSAHSPTPRGREAAPGSMDRVLLSSEMGGGGAFAKVRAQAQASEPVAPINNSERTRISGMWASSHAIKAYSRFGGR